MPVPRFTRSALGNRSKIIIYVAVVLGIFQIFGRQGIVKTYKMSNQGSEQKFSMNTRWGQPQLKPHSCTKWAVTATNDPLPSEAVRRYIYNPLWCLIVVRIKAEKDYTIPTTIGQNIIVLDEEEQRKIGLKFIDDLPKTLSSRKNVGYLYAIAHGSKVIYDFDDKAELKFWLNNSLPNNYMISFDDYLSPSDLVLHKPIGNAGSSGIFNPFPFLDLKSDLPAEKMPIKSILNEDSNFLAIRDFNITESKSRLGLLQSTIENFRELDYDHKEESKEYLTEMISLNKRAGVILPKGIYSPYSIRSNIYYQGGLWALFLPSSVEEPASDIWRSCITKTLFDILDIRTGFTYRSLAWIRRKKVGSLSITTKISILHKIKPLLIDLVSFKNGLKIEKYKNAPELIYDVWYFMYNRGHVYNKDLQDLKEWLSFLINVGYDFPPLPKGVAPSSHEAIQKQGIKVNFNIGKSISTRNVPSQCENLSSIPPQLFYTSDLHIAVRTDFPSTLAHLHQNVLVTKLRTIDTKYPHIFKMPGLNFTHNFSPVARNYVLHNTELTEEQLDAHIAYYKKNGKDVQDADAFFCGFPASICELWIPMNKTIVFVPAHRYNLGRCDFFTWKLLNARLKNLDRRRNIIGAISRYDVEYLDHYTDLDPEFFPSISKFYLQGTTYNPKNKNVIVLGNYFAVQRTFKGNYQHGLKPLGELFKFYTLKDISECKAIVYLTYSVMSYKLTEYYTMGIPLFIPSIKFFQTVETFGADRTTVSRLYCPQANNLKMFPSDSQASHPYNPNMNVDEDYEAEMYWLQYADFYDWPHIQLFDSKEHLYHLLQTVDLAEISRNMLKEVAIKEQIILNSWCSTIKRIYSLKSSQSKYQKVSASVGL